MPYFGGTFSLLDIAVRIENALARHPEAIALCIDEERFTYEQLKQRVLAIQPLLDDTAEQALIGILANDSLDTYASVLAVLRAGRAFLPLNPLHPTRRNLAILEKAGIRTLLAPHASLHQQFSPLPGIEVHLTCEAVSPTSRPLVICQSQDLAYLLFTSGSTGEPKGVPITRGNLAAFLDSLAASGFGIRREDRVLQMFDLTFDFSVATYLAPLSCGASVYVVPATHAKFTEVYRLLEEYRLTVAPVVPSVLSYLRPYFGDIRLPELRLTMLCGEALFADVVDEWMLCAPASRIANFYGPTEATVFAMVYDWTPLAGRSKAYNGVVSIGRCMPMNHALIVDEDLNPVAVGERGELCLAGPQVSPGYWRDESRNGRAFFARNHAGQLLRYYRTGDVVMADEEHDHYFCGRIGNQIKMQGFRVEPGEIEFHARQLTDGHECVVVHRVQPSGHAELNLVVENYAGDLKAVLTLLRVRVPHYMVPARALSLDRLPINANGKIDRVLLQRRLDASERTDAPALGIRDRAATRPDA
jgi:amino acid adenylation domain-containing protein